MVDSLSNRGFAQIVKSVVEGLEGGGNLSEEFAKHPSVFSTLFVNMINAGEQTGKLDDIFLHLSNYLEKESLLREKLVKALRYPMMMFVMAMAAIIIIAVFVIPVFADMIASAGAELPLATRILVAVSDFLRDNYLLMLVLLFSVAVSFSFHRATPKGKIFWDKFMLHTPIFGELVLKGVLGRFARSLMLVSSAGVPLLKGLSLVSGTVGNAYISLKIDKMHSKIDMGKSFLQSATEVEIFTPMILQILRVGEKTGEIEELLGHVADLYDREINSAMDNINTLIEPIMLILIGFIVLLLGLGAMLPYLEVLKSAIS
jgi:MSHA biogenesis protein MshG